MDEKYPEELYKKSTSTSASPFNPDQLAELEAKLRMGYPGVEIGTLSFRGTGGRPGWESIPKVMFEEIARHARINNIQLTIHAPVNDLQVSGIGNDGSISKQSKEEAAMKINAVLDAAANMAKIYGQGIKVNFHGGDIQTTQWRKDFEEKLKEYLRNNSDKFKELVETLYKWGYIDSASIKDPNQLPSWVFSFMDTIYFQVDKDTYVPYTAIGGRELYEKLMRWAKGEIKDTKEIRTIIDYIEDINKAAWNQILQSVNDVEKNIRFIVNPERGYPLLFRVISDIFSSKDPSSIGNLHNIIASTEYRIKNLMNYIDLIESSIEKDEKMKERYKEYLDILEKKRSEMVNILDELEKYNENLQHFIDRHKNEIVSGIFSDEMKKELFNIIGAKPEESLYTKYLNIYDKIRDIRGAISLGESYYDIPLVKPSQEVFIDNAADNFRKAFENFLERYKNEKDIDKIFPVILIENSYAGTAGSRPDLLEEYIKKLRDTIKDVLNEEKYSEIRKIIEEKYGSVDKFLDDHIGITVDVGHFRMYEQYGYNVNDIREWLREIKPYIKHIHVHETQWGSDTHLPLGFGWDDFIKQELEELKDLMAKKGVTMVHEPGGWYSAGFFNRYGPEFSYLLYGTSPTTQFEYYSNLYGPPTPSFSYSSITFYPNIYTPPTIPGTNIQYSPYSLDIFSNFPPELGGLKRGPTQTFSGTPLE